MAPSTGAAGDLVYDTASLAGVTRVLADTNGNLRADCEVRLNGIVDPAADHFLL